MNELFIVRLWRRSRVLGGISIVLAVLVVLVGAAVLAGLYRPNASQSMIWAAVTGFVLGLGFAAQTLTRD